MITSSSNSKVQKIRGLLQRRKDRQKSGLFAAEGVRLIEAGLQAGFKPEFMLFGENLSPRGQALVQTIQGDNLPIEQISEKLVNELSDTESTQGVFAVFHQELAASPHNPDFVVVLDNLRDPGNMGTILRSAAAADVQMIILTPGTTDPFAPKVIRSGMGAHFQLPIQIMNWGEIHTFCKEDRSPALNILVSEVHEGVTLWDVNMQQPCALVIGSEANGVSPEALQIADKRIHIPMPGQTESLNAGTAASIIIFECIRQRKP